MPGLPHCSAPRHATFFWVLRHPVASLCLQASANWHVPLSMRLSGRVSVHVCTCARMCVGAGAPPGLGRAAGRLGRVRAGGKWGGGGIQPRRQQARQLKQVGSEAARRWAAGEGPGPS